MSHVEGSRAGVLERALAATLSAVARLPGAPVEKLARAALDRRFARHPGATDFLVSLVAAVVRQAPQKDPHVVATFLRTLFVDEFLRGGAARDRVRRRMGGHAPELFVVSPTMRCNLTCTGCYSARYATDDELTTDELDDLLVQAKGLGLHFVVVSGGEPLLRPDLLDLVEKHDDMLFLSFTNGTLVPRHGRAQRLARLGNFIPCISVEGFEAETDARRGKGTFRRILDAMAALRDAGVFFGISATPTRANNELVVGDEFVDFWASQGALLAWYFNYMPVGRDPDLSLMPTPEQREYRRRAVARLRKTGPLVLADFWCDGLLTDGCLSAGMKYFHVNSRGGIEPCVFNQFAVDNIRNVRLADALDSRYFRYLRGRMHEVENVLRPCPIIDRPQILRDAVEKFGLRPSQEGGEATVTTLADGLTRYARHLRVLMDPAWEREYGGRPEVGTDHHLAR